jgi:hypothetical protein
MVSRFLNFKRGNKMASSNARFRDVYRLDEKTKAKRDFYHIRGLDVTNPEVHLWFWDHFKKTASPELMKLYLLEYMYV